MSGQSSVYLQCVDLADFRARRPRRDKLWESVALAVVEHRRSVNKGQQRQQRISDEQAYQHLRSLALSSAAGHTPAATTTTTTGLQQPSSPSAPPTPLTAAVVAADASLVRLCSVHPSQASRSPNGQHSPLSSASLSSLHSPPAPSPVPSAAKRAGRRRPADDGLSSAADDGEQYHADGGGALDVIPVFGSLTRPAQDAGDLAAAVLSGVQSLLPDIERLAGVMHERVQALMDRVDSFEIRLAARLRSRQAAGHRSQLRIWQLEQQLAAARQQRQSAALTAAASRLRTLVYHRLPHRLQDKLALIDVLGDGRCLLRALLLAWQAAVATVPALDGLRQLMRAELQSWSDQRWEARVPSRWQDVDAAQQPLSRQQYIDKFLTQPAAHLPISAIYLWQAMMAPDATVCVLVCDEDCRRERVELLLPEQGLGPAIIVLQRTWQDGVGHYAVVCQREQPTPQTVFSQAEPLIQELLRMDAADAESERREVKRRRAAEERSRKAQDARRRVDRAVSTATGRTRSKASRSTSASIASAPPAAIVIDDDHKNSRQSVAPPPAPPPAPVPAVLTARPQQPRPAIIPPSRAKPPMAAAASRKRQREEEQAEAERQEEAASKRPRDSPSATPDNEADPVPSPLALTFRSQQPPGFAGLSSESGRAPDSPMDSDSGDENLAHSEFVTMSDTAATDDAPVGEYAVLEADAHRQFSEDPLCRLGIQRRDGCLLAALMEALQHQHGDGVWRSSSVDRQRRKWAEQLQRSVSEQQYCALFPPGWQRPSFTAVLSGMRQLGQSVDPAVLFPLSLLLSVDIFVVSRSHDRVWSCCLQGRTRLHAECIALHYRLSDVGHSHYEVMVSERGGVRRWPRDSTAARQLQRWADDCAAQLEQPALPFLVHHEAAEEAELQEEPEPAPSTSPVIHVEPPPVKPEPAEAEPAEEAADLPHVSVDAVVAEVVEPAASPALDSAADLAPLPPLVSVEQPAALEEPSQRVEAAVESPASPVEDSAAEQQDSVAAAEPQHVVTVSPPSPPEQELSAPEATASEAPHSPPRADQPLAPQPAQQEEADRQPSPVADSASDGAVRDYWEDDCIPAQQPVGNGDSGQSNGDHRDGPLVTSAPAEAEAARPEELSAEDSESEQQGGRSERRAREMAVTRSQTAAALKDAPAEPQVSAQEQETARRIARLKDRERQREREREQAKAEHSRAAGDPGKRCLWVQSRSTMHAEELRSIFSHFGVVLRVDVPPPRALQLPFAFIHYESESDAELVLSRAASGGEMGELTVRNYRPPDRSLRTVPHRQQQQQPQRPVVPRRPRN